MVFSQIDVSGRDNPAAGTAKCHYLGIVLALTCSPEYNTETNPRIKVIFWDGTEDPGNPYNWSLCQKWALTLLAVWLTFITMINGTVITVAREAINEEFNISDTNFPNSYWPITSWAVGGGCFSLLILPLMEDYGMRKVCLLTYVAFLCFLIPQAAAQTFATLIVARFFAGGCAAVLANTSATVIGNIWDSEKSRTVPVSLFIASYLMGSSIGPVVGAAILQFLSWRWIGYIQLIWYGVFFPIYVRLFKECRGIAILGERAKTLRQEGKMAYTQHDIDSQGKSILRIVARSVKRPLWLFCTEPVVFVSTLWSAFTVGTLYLFTQSVEQVVSGLYGWTPVQAGYVQSAIVIGECVGWVGALLSGKVYFNSASRNTEVPGTPIPEARLYLAIIGGIFGISGGMFTYAWTSYPNLSWIGPAIGLGMVGAGSVVVVTGLSDYFVDAYSTYAGSVIAIVATGENIFSAFLPLAAANMYSHLGFQWASSLLALVSLALAFVPILVLTWGRQIRARSPFMKESMAEKRGRPST